MYADSADRPMHQLVGPAPAEKLTHMFQRNTVISFRDLELKDQTSISADRNRSRVSCIPSGRQSCCFTVIFAIASNEITAQRRSVDCMTCFTA